MPTYGQSTALEGAHIIKSSPGFLYNIWVTPSSTLGYLMVFNATSVPADGAVAPLINLTNVETGSGTLLGIDFAKYPRYFSQGIVCVYSSTGFYTKTESSTGFFNWSYE